MVQDYDVDVEEVQHDVDRDGHRLRGVPRPRPRARRADGRVGEGSGLASRRTTSARRTGPERHAQDLLDEAARSPGAVFDTCAYCHGNKTNVFTGFRAGERYADFALPFLVSEPIPANDLQGEFWPDGRPNRFNRPQALMLSGCFKAGAIACTNCHVAHGSRNEFSLKVNINQGRNGDPLCTQCHTEPRSKPQALRPSSRRSVGTPGYRQHTFHAPDSPGSRCITCHMSDVNWRLLMRRRDHTFKPPVPELTAKFGVPNACNTCHDDKSPEWAAKQMNAWWGDADRRAKEASHRRHDVSRGLG